MKRNYIKGFFIIAFALVLSITDVGMPAISSPMENVVAKTNKKHKHYKGRHLGRALLNTYLSRKCTHSSYKVTGKYFRKGTIITIKQICYKNGLCYVTGRGSNGRRLSGWVTTASIYIY